MLHYLACVKEAGDSLTFYGSATASQQSGQSDDEDARG